MPAGICSMYAKPELYPSDMDTLTQTMFAMVSVFSAGSTPIFMGEGRSSCTVGINGGDLLGFGGRPFWYWIPYEMEGNDRAVKPVTSRAVRQSNQ